MLEEDFGIFFDQDDFGIRVTIDGQLVDGILSEDQVEVDFVQTKKPVFTCKSADVESVQYDSILINGSSTYKVKQIQLDETQRVTALILEKQ